MHTFEVQYVSIFKHLLSFVIGYNNNPEMLTDNANNELEKCNRNSGMDIWWLPTRLKKRHHI